MRKMKKAAFAGVAVSTLLILLAWSQFVAAAEASTPTLSPPPDGGIILSPLSGHIYPANLLMLEIKFPTALNPNSNKFGSDGYYYITYSIDGQEPVRIPEAFIHYQLSNGVLTPNNLTANLALPKLTDGVHTLTVNAREPYMISAYGYYSRQEMVTFTIKTPSPSPNPTQTPSPTPTLSPSTTPTPTQSPTLTPSTSPSVPEFPAWTLLPLAVATAVGVLVWVRRRRAD
jgi:hypothetical protein